MGTFTASHHRTANQSTTNVDFHSRLGWLAADGLNYCRVSDNFRDKNDNFCHIRHGSCHQPAVVVTNPAENESRGQNETKARPNNPMIRQDSTGSRPPKPPSPDNPDSPDSPDSPDNPNNPNNPNNPPSPNSPNSPNSSKQSKQSTQSRQFRQATSTPWTLHSPSVCCDAWDYDAWDPDAWDYDAWGVTCSRRARSCAIRWIRGRCGCARTRCRARSGPRAPAMPR